MKELMDFVRELSFVRVGGSPEEKKAGELIMEEVNRTAEDVGRDDVRGEYMTFKVPAAEVKRCSVEAGGRQIACVPFLRSGNINRECGLLYLDEASEIDFSGIGDLGARRCC